MTDTNNNNEYLPIEELDEYEYEYLMELNQWYHLFNYSNPIFGDGKVSYRIIFERGLYYIDYKIDYHIHQTNKGYSTMEQANNHAKRLASHYRSSLNLLNDLT